MLTLWLILNLVPSAVIVAVTITGRGHTPAIHGLLDADELAALSTDAISTMDSIAVFANGLNLAFCLVMLAVVWVGLRQAQPWSFWTVAIGLSAAILAGVGADGMVGFLFPQVNWISAAIAASGLGLASLGARRMARSVPGQSS